MSEACIYGNVYVPTAALPNPKDRYENHFLNGGIHPKKSGLRILVFIHGGAFQSGSADSDLYGPEYLVGEGIILITFNYRYEPIYRLLLIRGTYRFLFRPE